MSEEPDFEMRESYDFSQAARGRHAARMTAREREELLLSSAAGDVQTWLSYALQQVQALEMALFTYLVLGVNHSPEEAWSATAASFDVGPDPLLALLRRREMVDGEFETRFPGLVKQRRWLVHQGHCESQAALGSLEEARSLRSRLETIATEATAMAAQLQRLVEQHLSVNGLSRQEIERRTGETARLWRSAA